MQEDFYSKTMSGGIITIVCSAMMVVLFLSELGVHLQMLPGILLDTTISCALRVDVFLRAFEIPEPVSRTVPDIQDGTQARGGHFPWREDYYQCTLSGGFQTSLCYYACVRSFPENVYPDGCEGKAVLQLDITLPRMPCDWVSVDAVDASGRVQSAIEHEVFRQRLSARGRKVQGTELHEVGPKNGTLPEHLKPDALKLPDDYCGSCYGAEEQEGDCCNTCEVVRVKYQKKGWVMPEYDTIEQCKREGYQDNMARMVRRQAHISHLCMLIVDHWGACQCHRATTSELQHKILEVACHDVPNRLFPVYRRMRAAGYRGKFMLQRLLEEYSWYQVCLWQRSTKHLLFAMCCVWSMSCYYLQTWVNEE